MWPICDADVVSTNYYLHSVQIYLLCTKNIIEEEETKT